MKKLLLLSLAMMLTFSSQAIRPRHMAFPYAQSDGTSLMAYKHGDGFYAFSTSLDDLVLVPNASGDLCYAVLLDGKLVASSMIAHEEGARTEAEKQFIAAHPLSLAEAAEATTPVRHHENEPRRIIGVSTSDGLGKFGQSGTGGVNSIGKYTIPVIMAQYPDLKFQPTTTIEKMTRYFNEKGYKEEAQCKGSARDYFLSQSNGMFDPTFEVVAIVTVPQSYKFYGSNSARGGDQNVPQFVADAVAAAKAAGVDFSKYVVNGSVPLVSVLYAGPGEATEGGNGADYIWPQEFDVNRTMSGVHFNSYFVGNELDHNRTLMGMGVFCHEFGHALGLPDFYATNGSYSHDDAFGAWSIMDGGAFVNGGRAPEGYTAYERSVMGWLKIKELTDPQDVTLDSYDTEDGQQAVLIRNSSKEYFILENRQPGTWYPANQGSGLLLTRIAYNAQEWNWNIPNNVQTRKRAMVVTANGEKLYYNANQANLYGNGVNEIKSFPLFDGSKLGTKPVTSITKVGKQIKFSFMADLDTIYSEPFAKDLGKFTVQDVSLSEGVTKVWRFQSYYGAKGSAHVGLKNYAAESWLLSPVIDLKYCQNAKLFFKHSTKLFGGTNDQITLWVRENESDTWKQVTDITYPTADWSFIDAAPLGVSLAEYDGKTVQLGFKYSSTDQAAPTWNIKNLLLTGKNTTPTSIQAVPNVVPSTRVVYDLQGRRVENPTKGLYIVNGKKVLF